MASTSQIMVLLLVINIQCVVTNSVPNITITGSIARNKFTSDLINISSNWYQAFNYCRTYGYQGLEIVGPIYTRVKAIKEFLWKHVPSSQTTVWLDHFRPSKISSDWFTHHCKVSVTSSDLGTYQPSDQCSVLHYNPDSTTVLEFQARDCLSRHPFMCFNSGSRKAFINYDGYRVLSLLMHFYVVENQTREACENKTFKDTNSPVYEYNHNTWECTLYTLPWNQGYVEYNIYFSDENITTGVLDGMYNMTFINDTGDVYNDVSETFPYCGKESETTPQTTRETTIETIPDDYCQCSPKPTTQIPAAVTEQLVIPKKSTAKFKRKLTSADDKRSSSKVIGAVGIAVIIVECGLIILFDVLTIFMKTSTDKIK